MRRVRLTLVQFIVHFDLLAMDTTIERTSQACDAREDESFAGAKRSPGLAILQGG